MKRLECFGTANMSDCCAQCPDNNECVDETMKRFLRLIHLYVSEQKVIKT